MRQLCLVIFLLFGASICLTSASTDASHCYWTNECHRLCAESEYVVSDSERKKNGTNCIVEGGRNRYCCPIPTGGQNFPDNWGHGLTCGKPGGMPCQNLIGFATNCYWAEECGRSCRTGEYTAALSGRLLSKDKVCLFNEGKNRFCCRGPHVRNIPSES